MIHDRNYYSRSTKLPLAVAAAAALFLPACTSASEIAARAPVVPFTALGHDEARSKMLGREPVVISFEKGDPVPLAFDLDSQLFEPGVQRLTLVADRRFFVLFQPGDVPRSSLDGKDFDTRSKNYFRFGLGVKKDTGAYVDVGLGLRPRAK